MEIVPSKERPLVEMYIEGPFAFMRLSPGVKSKKTVSELTVNCLHG